MEALLRIAVVLVLVLVNAFFVAAEFSIVTVRRTRIEQLVGEGHAMARSLRKAVNNPAPFIAATQLGVTMTSVALGSVGEPYLAVVFEPFLTPIDLGPVHIAARSLAGAIAFFLITGTTIVLGELIPKSLALQRPEAVGFVIIEPLLIFQAILLPFVVGLTAAGALGLRLFGLAPTTGHGLVYSVDELKMLVTASRQGGELEASEEAMIERLFTFADIHAHEVMVPRTEMVTVPATATVGQVLELAGQTSHARFPVYETSADDIVGVIYVVDLLRRFGKGNLERLKIRPFVREALVLPETITVDLLVEKMRLNRTHLAILLDEYGGTAGLVTLSDVLERITGPLPDQFEQPPPQIQELSDGSLIVDGLARLDELNEKTGLNLQSDVYDTVGGFVLGEIGRRPEIGDTVTVDDTRFQVEALDGLRIARVRIWPAKREESSVEAEEV
ncbi:MAG TPA: hemolysin family protein [Chloroflexota bacterium]|nr:hemolysin family protein [Chloroflexota bacterium]